MADLNALVDQLSELTVLEAAELSKLLEEKWGVSAAAAVAVAGPAAGGGAAAAARARRWTITAARRSAPSCPIRRSSATWTRRQCGWLMRSSAAT